MLVKLLNVIYRLSIEPHAAFTPQVWHKAQLTNSSSCFSASLDRNGRYSKNVDNNDVDTQ